MREQAARDKPVAPAISASSAVMLNDAACIEEASLVVLLRDRSMLEAQEAVPGLRRYVTR
jgi:hypothetical protein